MEELVSIIVICYNSGKTIVETLDSIYKQTYLNIELIITDDCSTDNTLDLCKQWISTHSDRFVSATIIKSNKNTGVSANCNRGIKEAQGEWIKEIAGDDILLPNCIQAYINYINSNKNISICVSKAQCFHKTHKGEIVYGNIIPSIENQEIYKKTPIEQLKILLKGNIIVTPTIFVKKDLLNRFHYNEIYRFMEDIPFYIDITSNNIKIHFLDDITVLYRFSSQSLSQANSTFFPTRMFETKAIYFLNEKKEIMKNYLPSSIKQEQKRLMLWSITEYYLRNDASSILNRIIFKILNKIL